MLEEEREIPICRVEKGRIIILPNDYPIEHILRSEPQDLIQIIKECSENLQPAWYFGGTKIHKPRRSRFKLLNQGLTTREEMVQGYTEEFEENLRLAKEFESTEADLFDEKDP